MTALLPGPSYFCVAIELVIHLQAKESERLSSPELHGLPASSPANVTETRLSRVQSKRWAGCYQQHFAWQIKCLRREVDCLFAAHAISASLLAPTPA